MWKLHDLTASDVQMAEEGKEKYKVDYRTFSAPSHRLFITVDDEHFPLEYILSFDD